jgi:hypothetical protein
MPTRSEEGNPHYEGEKRYACAIADQPAWDAMGQPSMGPAPRMGGRMLTDWNPLDLGVRKLDGSVVERKHAMEGLDEELAL